MLSRLTPLTSKLTGTLLRMARVPVVTYSTAAPVTLLPRMKEDMKAAMRAKEKKKVTVIKSVIAAVIYAQKSAGAGPEAEADAVVASILRKSIKSREESISTYEAAGRADLAEVEKAEALLLRAYLPTPYTEEELTAAAIAAISSTGVSTVKEMGKAMREINLEESRIDRRLLSEIIKRQLSA